MSTIDENDLYNYFQRYQEYEQIEDKELRDELDKRLSAYKDQFHREPDAVLKLLEEGKDDFMERYATAYADLVFDLEMHAESMEAIRRTHDYDAERDMWVPKPK